MIKVSIIVPVYNVQKYLRQCLDSIVNQTLKEIEIICVDDGSTDLSGEILDEYADKDTRIQVIHKENSGYGHSMNLGLNAAKGEYIGIVESDDYAELNMFEELYQIAHEAELDIVKSSFYFYYSIPKERNEKYEIVSKVLAKRTICPLSYFTDKMELVEFYNIKPTIWSALYKSTFIKKNAIKFLETPGASYQDASFNFKVMALAEKVQLLREAYVHYRQDSENSSINSKGKVFCVCDEYAEMQRFLDARPVLKGKLEYVLQRIKYDSYMWNYARVSQRNKYIFLERASEEFRDGLEEGSIRKEYFEEYKWNNLNAIVNDAAAFHTGRALEQGAWYWKSEYERITNSITYKIGYCITIGPRIVLRFIRCVHNHGIKYTFTVSFTEFRGGKNFAQKS